MRASLRVVAPAAAGVVLLCTTLLAAQYFRPSISPLRVTTGPNGAPPTLGNYPDTSLPLSTNTTVTPDAASTNTTRINVSTSTNFQGTLEGDLTTGVVRVTDARPAGIYTIMVSAFNSSGLTVTRTFTLTVTTPVTCTLVNFAAAAIFSSGGHVPNSVAVGDFNRDGQQDLAVANMGIPPPMAIPGNVSILLGDGAGNFSAPTSYVIGYFSSVAVGDFDGDGKQDLVLANFVRNNVSILLGDGNGNFSAPTNFGAGNGPSSVAVGDFNGDGKQDLVVANYFSQNVSILLGDGTGHFSPATNFGVDGRPLFVAVGDFNGDGRQDLAVANYDSLNVSILWGDGAGNFSPAINFPVGAYSYSVAVGDFNADGKQDLAVANDKGVSILLGDGAGNFSPATNFAAGYGPDSVSVGDFNADGKQDLAVINYGSFNVSILLGDGAGSFSPATNFPVGTHPYSGAVGDFNGDGKQDLAVANRDSDNVSILLRICEASPTPTPMVNISGTISYCSNPVPAPVPGVTLTLTGTALGTTLSDSSGNYMFSVPSGGSYTVTPSKAALPPASHGINTVDVVAVQRHFLQIGTPLSGCRLTGADVNGDSVVNTVDVVAIQRFFLALSTGTANVGHYQFNPSNRTYQNITTNQTSQNYNALVFGDVATPYVH